MNRQTIFSSFIILLLIGNGFLVVAQNPRTNKNNDYEDNSVNDWWPMFQHDVMNTGLTSYQKIEIDEDLWRFNANGTISGISVFEKRIICSTVSEDNRPSAKSYVYCLDMQGTIIWCFEALGDFNTHPTIVSDAVFIGNSLGYMYCLHFETGELIWSVRQSMNRVSSPLVVDQKVVYESLDGNVYCIHAETGQFLWAKPISNDVLSNHAVFENNVYVGNHCLDLETGSIIWTSSISVYFLSSIAYGDGRIYVGSQDEKFYCLNATSGEKVWKSYSGSMTWITAPALGYGNVYVGNHFGYIYCLDAASGEYQWSTKMSSRAVSSPVLCGKHIYFGSEDNTLYCLDAFTGEKKAEFLFSSPFLCSMAIADSKLFCASGNILFCFGSDVGNGDLASTGSLQFNDVAPGIRVEGIIYVYNEGPIGSVLDWEISSYPTWGNWTISPSFGFDVSVEDKPTPIEISIETPSIEQEFFNGKIRIINSNNASDVEIIDVSLSIAKQKQWDIYDWIVSVLLKQETHGFLCKLMDMAKEKNDLIFF